ncbi:hypothetical protein [Clostridium felsineum]|uniref:hypothetical protein n=1 Tax=Clostridium felsineum TaxID=36839 RepID=UPI00098BDB82|nr:hypothetical protein [Clostridium felsineum]URZ16796.1 Antitoxin [Clostridium felsineum DSM 794]
MKYSYKFDEIVFKSGRKSRIIIMEEQVQLVSEFLMSDAEVDSESYIEALDSVLNEESEYEELNGNVCGILIHKDKTKVIDCLAEDGMGDWCEIETKELRELIDIWCDEVKRFKEQNK